jgi:serine phosphatase RsbU (regulator of sigma subunit)
VIFGGVNGFNMINPSSMEFNPHTPPVMITEFRIFNKPMLINAPGSPLDKDISQTREIVLDYKQTIVSLNFVALNFLSPEKNQYAYMLEGMEQEWNEVGNNRTATYTNLLPGKYIFRVKASNNDGVWNEKGIALSIIMEPPFWQSWWFKLLIAFSIIGGAVSFYKIRINVVNAQKKNLEHQVEERTLDLKNVNNALQVQGKKLEQLFDEVKESIRAAQAIQQTILPSLEFIKKHLPELFIINKPKDVVSGDFYWFDVVDERIIFASVDCTGHGVSGALMSITGHHLLNQCVYPYKDFTAGDVLNKLHKGVIQELHGKNDNHEIQDGMDVALCILDMDRKKLQYAGANSPLYILRNNEIIQIRGNKYSIGLTIGADILKFTNNEVDLQEGDIVYLFSDGYADQFGGQLGDEKFKYNQFRDFLVTIGNQSLESQGRLLEEKFIEWKGGTEQIDDVLVIGFKPSVFNPVVIPEKEKISY